MHTRPIPLRNTGQGCEYPKAVNSSATHIAVYFPPLELNFIHIHTKYSHLTGHFHLFKLGQ